MKRININHEKIKFIQWSVKILSFFMSDLKVIFLYKNHSTTL